MSTIADTNAAPALGTPVYNPAYGKTGCIAAISGESARAFTLGMGRMTPILSNFRCVWDDGSMSEVPDSIARPWVAAAARMGLPPVSDYAARLAKAEVKQAEGRLALEREREESAKARAAFSADAAERIPGGAKSVIVGELIQDESDSMTDYFHSRAACTVILAFSTHTRDIFSEMRKAALNCPETEHLATAPESAEHREKYSMGGGYYLKAGYRHNNGWQVRKVRIRGVDDIPMGEWFAEPPRAVSAQPANIGGIRIEEHTHTKKGFQMWICVLPDRVERAEFERLRDLAQAMGGWYSRPWGKTPGGFAFKDKVSAEAFANPAEALDDSKPVGGACTPAPTPKIGSKLRELADRMQSDIDSRFAPRLTNTPKRQREADAARIEGRRLERTQAALRALADMHDAGTVPDALRRITSRKAAYDLLGAHIDRKNAGYYDAGIDTGKPALSTPDALALWSLIGEASEESLKVEELRRKVDALRFANIPGYFPTPAPVVARMIEAARIPEGKVSILEPSAGSGAILDALRDGFPLATLYAYERHASLRDVLRLKGYDLIGADFMEWTTGHRFDRVLMNPPFENGQDIEHVMRAHSRLMSGGRLVAIMSPGPFFRSDQKSAAFREWFERLGGEREDVPAGAFKESGTCIATVLITVEAHG